VLQNNNKNKGTTNVISVLVQVPEFYTQPNAIHIHSSTSGDLTGELV